MSTCRLRKVSCGECGYTVRVTRSWMLEALPECPICHQTMTPDSGADLAYLGLVTEADVKATEWTRICRENGWEDSIQRRGGAARAFQHKYDESGGLMARKAGAGHCAYAGCGRWITDGADRCSAGHAQHDHATELAAIPF